MKGDFYFVRAVRMPHVIWFSHAVIQACTYGNTLGEYNMGKHKLHEAYHHYAPLARFRLIA